MEEINEIGNEVRSYNVKRENIRKVMEDLKSVASDLLVFNFQWNDLDDYHKSVEEKLDKRFKELVSKEIELQQRAKVVEAAEAVLSDLEIKSEEKRKELDILRNQVKFCVAESKKEEIRLTQLQTQSSELIKTQGEIQLKVKQLGQIKIDVKKHRGELSVEMKRLHLSRTRKRELDEEIHRKGLVLATILNQTRESVKKQELLDEKLNSQKKLLDARSLEVKSKEKKLAELKLDLDLREHMVKTLNDEMEETGKQMEPKAKKLEDIERLIEERSAYCESIKLLIEEHAEELSSKKKKHKEMLEVKQEELRLINEEIKRCSGELESKRSDRDHMVKTLNDEMEETGKQMEPKAKKLEDIERLIEERSAYCESIKLLIEEHTEELASKKKKHNEMLEVKQEELRLINEEIKRCSGELESKRSDRDQVQGAINELTVQLKSKECELNSENKIQDLESKEAKQARLEAALVEYEKEVGLKKKDLDTREEKIDDKYQQLKSMEQNLTTSVTKYEQRAKRLYISCQQSNTNQQDLQLVLHGHLKKCYELQLDVMSVLKSSSDPSKLVLDSIKELHSSHQEITGTNLDPLISVGRSTIYLLECLMSVSPKPNTEVQGEAVKFVTGLKEKTIVKSKDPVEVLGFLHSLAVFSSAYTFNAEKVQNLFDITFLGKYVSSLCKALGVSALALLHNALPFNDKPYEAPNSNSNDLSHNVQKNVASSHLACGDAIKDRYGSSSFSPCEGFIRLRYMKDPSNYVLSSVNSALMATRKRGELCLSEPIVEILVPLLEELPGVIRSSEYLQSEARKVAELWSLMMGASARKSPREIWGFLHLIVAFGLVDLTKQKEFLQFVSYVAHFRQAPRLFQSLGLSCDIPYFVEQLAREGRYIQAIRFVFCFNLMNMFYPMEFLKGEINSLRRSCKEKTRIESQAEETKLREIIELIEEFKLEIDLPSDLIVKFMIPRETHNRNQCASVPFQPPVHMQASPPVMHSPYISGSHGSNPNIPTLFGVQLNPQVPIMDQAGGSTQSSYQVGFKRPRVDPRVPSSVIRPYLNPSSGNGR